MIKLAIGIVIGASIAAVAQGLFPLTIQGQFSGPGGDGRPAAVCIEFPVPKCYSKSELEDAVRGPIPPTPPVPLIKGMKEMYSNMVPAPGIDSGGNAAVIKVDSKGRVYCSPEQTP